MKYEVGKRIKYYREKMGLTQRKFAELLGVSNTRVSNWELGDSRPDVDLLMGICEVLHVAADELLDIKLSDEKLTREEKEIVDTFRNFSGEDKIRLFGYMEALKEKSQ